MFGFVLLGGLALLGLTLLLKSGKKRMAVAATVVIVTWMVRYLYGLPAFDHPLGVAVWMAIVAGQLWFIAEVVIEGRRARRNTSPVK